MSGAGAGSDGTGPAGAWQAGPRRMVRSETGGCSPDLELPATRDDPPRARAGERARDPVRIDPSGVTGPFGRPRPRPRRPGLALGRLVAGVVVAVVGYILAVFPALITYDVGMDGYGYYCETGMFVEADLACFGDPTPAAEAFALFVAMVTVPAALGVLVAWPRRRGLLLLLLACAALGLYAYLVLANPRT